MEFLRRLHPGHTARDSAARLDLPPRWAAARDAPAASALDAAPAEARTIARRAAQRGSEAAARDASGPGVAAPVWQAQGGPRVAADASPAATPPPPQTPPMPQMTPHAGATPRASASPTRDSKAAAARPASASQPEVWPAGRAAPAAAAVQPGTAVPRRAAAPGVRAASTNAPVPPIRVQALPQRSAAPVAARQVVQVTIDRLDVRLPEPRPEARPDRGRERRPAPAVTSLADYLRGKEPGR